MSPSLNAALLFVTFSLFLTHKSYSQENEIPKSGTFEKFIGNIKGCDFYWVKNESFSSTILKHKNEKFISKTEFNGNYNLRLQAVSSKYRTGDSDLEYKDWFINNDTLISLVQKTSKNEVWLQINKYDENFMIVDSINVLHESIENYKLISYTYKQIANKIGIIGSTNSTENESFFIIFDFNSNHVTSYKFAIAEKQILGCSDFTFNDKNDFFAIYEGEENTRNNCDKPKPEKFLSYAVYNIGEKIDLIKLKTNENDYIFKSFKLLPLNEKELIVGALMFSSLGGMPMLGYQISIMEFGNNSILKQSVSIAEDLKILSIWSTVDAKLISKDNLCTNSYYQILKEIKLLPDGSIICISEDNYVGCGGSSVDFTGGPTTISGGGISITGSSTISSRGIHHYANRSSDYLGILIVSKINSSNYKVLWTAKTINRNRIIYPFISNEYNYFLDFNIKKNVMTFYYEDVPRNFDENGELIEKYRLSTYESKENTIARFEIDLENGKYSLKEFKPILIDDKRQLISVGSSHIVNEGELIFFTYISKNHFNQDYKIFIRPR